VSAGLNGQPRGGCVAQHQSFLESDHPAFQLYTPTLQSKGLGVVVAVLARLVVSSVTVWVLLALMVEAAVLVKVAVLVKLVVLVRLLVADDEEDVLTRSDVLTLSTAMKPDMARLSSRLSEHEDLSQHLP